ncbi:MAG: class I SAM-dependent methyltransferase [Patescibacteria group bacterium]|nr:class I SAM-dependent methyltransferase [Patescibacteria group bacterium]
MDAVFAQKLIEKTQDYYEQRAQDFSASRQRDWPLFISFANYIKKGDRVLDLGCGNGRLYPLVSQKGASYLGVDASKRLLQEAKRDYGSAEFQAGNILDLKLPPQSFDVAVLIAVLHHIPSRALRQEALCNAAKLVKAGGLVLLTNWNLFQTKFCSLRLRYNLKKVLGKNKMDFNDVLYKEKRYYHGFTKREIGRLLQNAGLRVVENYYEKDGIKTDRWKGQNLVTVGRK